MLETHPRSSRATAAIGLSLVIAGALLLAGQFLRLDVWRAIWPMFVLVPGAVLLAAAWSGGASAAPLAIPGSLASMTGLLLLYQSLTGHWESWAYGWSLVVPMSLGLGLVLAGRRSGSEGMVRTGEAWARFGLVLFLVGGFFFEMVLGISGGMVGRIFWPAMLVLAGVYLIARRSRPSGGSPAPASTLPVPPTSAAEAPAQAEAGGENAQRREE